MSVGVACRDLNGVQYNFEIPHLPDSCPLCHRGITPAGVLYAYYDTHNNAAQLIFRCPRIECQSLFIATYSRRTPHLPGLTFESAVPTTLRPRDFSQTIQELSPEFCDIYNQSLSAETDGLMKICGSGYRKALEFLIKDYLCKTFPEKGAEIKSKFLGKCIEGHISNEQIKTVAKRAAWLGNDETHYLRVWEGKDLQDLKKLIDLTVHWIEMEQLTNDVAKEMPEQ